MRRREHVAICQAVAAAHQEYTEILREQIDALRSENRDLLNRCMSKDWTQYTALSAEPQPPLPDTDWIYDPTGIVAIDRTLDPDNL